MDTIWQFPCLQIANSFRSGLYSIFFHSYVEFPESKWFVSKTSCFWIHNRTVRWMLISGYPSHKQWGAANHRCGISCHGWFRTFFLGPKVEAAEARSQYESNHQRSAGIRLVWVTLVSFGFYIYIIYTFKTLGWWFSNIFTISQAMGSRSRESPKHGASRWSLSSQTSQPSIRSRRVWSLVLVELHI